MRKRLREQRAREIERASERENVNLQETNGIIHLKLAVNYPQSLS